MELFSNHKQTQDQSLCFTECSGSCEPPGTCRCNALTTFRIHWQAQWPELHQTCEPSFSHVLLCIEILVTSLAHISKLHSKSLDSSNLYLFHIHRLKHCKIYLYYMACRWLDMIIIVMVFSLAPTLAEPHKHHKVILQKLQKGLSCPTFCYYSIQHSFCSVSARCAFI